MAKKGIASPGKCLSYQDSLDFELRRYWAITKDTTASDSIRHLAKGKVKEIAIKRAEQHPAYHDLLSKYQSGDSLRWETLVNRVSGFDTLSGVFDSSPQEVFAAAERAAESAVIRAGGVGALGVQFAKAEQLKQLPEQYMNEYKKYSDPEMMEKEAKQKAADEAVKLFEENANIKGAQAHISKLMSKYRSFTNADDLSDAVKHTSLKGRTFKERLVVGGHFNLTSTHPLSIDFSPQLGYRFNTRFFVGIGMNYRTTFGDSIKNGYYVSPNNTSYKMLASYDLIRAFYGYAEWEKSGITINGNDKSSRTWKDNFFIGLGKKFLVHPKLYFTLTALYNLNNETKNPVHPDRFQIRMGFQLSELATRAKKVYYDPNRQ